MDSIAMDQKWRLLAGLWGLYFCFGLGFSSLPPLVQPIRAELDISASEIGMILGAWQFVYIFCAIPAALFMLRFGVRAALSISVVLILVSLVLRVFAPDYQIMLLAVALLGVAGPVVSIGCPFLVAHMFDGKSFAFAMGFYATAPVLANMLAFSFTGPVLLPAFQGDWRAVSVIWACLSVLFGGLWAFLTRSGGLAAKEPLISPASSIARSDYAFFIRICVVGVLVFFVDHGFKAWLPEILRTAGFATADVALWSTLSIGMWLVALLIVPGLINSTQSFRRALLFVCTLLAMGTIGTMISPPGPAFVVACLAMGFAIGPLMTLGLMPILTRPGMTGALKIMVMAMFFTTAEIGGTLGPVMLGASFDFHGGFDHALWSFILIALAIPLVLMCPVNLYRVALAKGDLHG